MRPLTIATTTFGILAGLFVLNRFFDLLAYSDRVTVIFILFYSFLPSLVMLAGLFFLYRGKTAGIWILIISCSYLIVRHGLMYRTLRFRQQTFATPEHIAERFSIQHVDVIFWMEVIAGIFSLFLLTRNKSKWIRNP